MVIGNDDFSGQLHRSLLQKRFLLLWARKYDIAGQESGNAFRACSAI
jgi:hypothetical protein